MWSDDCGSQDFASELGCMDDEMTVCLVCDDRSIDSCHLDAERDIVSCSVYLIELGAGLTDLRYLMMRVEDGRTVVRVCCFFP